MTSKKASVLVIDDSEDILETMQQFLSQKGYVVETANTGAKAIEKVGARFFNVALIDIKLPDMSGVDVLKNIRRKSPTTLNVMITGYAALENAVESLNQGAFAFLQKPLDVGKVADTVERSVETQRELAVETEKNVAEFIKRRAEKLRREGKLA